MALGSTSHRLRAPLANVKGVFGQVYGKRFILLTQSGLGDFNVFSGAVQLLAPPPLLAQAPPTPRLTTRALCLCNIRFQSNITLDCRGTPFLND